MTSDDAASAAIAWIPLPNGAFFPIGEDAIGPIGYAVLDEPTGAKLWSAYGRLGGHHLVGKPLSRPFGLPDARTYQVFEYATLRWTPGAALAEIADTMDLLWATGHDEWVIEHGLPAMRALGADAEVLTRMSWLTDDVLRDAYFGAHFPDAEDGLTAALARYGLPASRPEVRDGVLLQRFDRTVLVRDLTSDVVSALPVGTLLVQSALLPAAVLAPDRTIGGPLVLRAPRTVLSWPNARGWGVAEPLPIPTATPTPVPVATATMTSSVTPTPPSPAPSSTARPSGNQATPTFSAAAAPQAGAILVVKAVVNQGRAEHVIIANEGTIAQELTGWSIRSGAGGQQLAFPAGFVLTPGATVRVHSGTGASTQNRPPTDLFGTGSNIWNNSGDVAMLVDPTGRVVHQLSYAG